MIGWLRLAWLFGALPALAALPAAQPSPTHLQPLQARPFDGTLNVMTYNIHGLPWPVADGRPGQLARIGQTLRNLHVQGKAPEVVLLQEAFTSEARAVGREAGYRYVAYGPSTEDRVDAALPPNGGWRALLGGRRWLKGEGLGRFVGSGLAILSDYPISDVRKMTYSSPLCAGFDCLAGKGAMIARVTLPGARQVEIATTHMNSRGAAAVAPQRSDLAWGEQGKELVSFIAHRRDPALPLVLGGDFNVGKAPPRVAGMASLVAGLGRNTRDGLRSLAALGTRFDEDARHELSHAKDWELSLPGQQGRLVAASAAVPFGNNAGAPLSDHFGYEIRWSLPALPANMTKI